MGGTAVAQWTDSYQHNFPISLTEDSGASLPKVHQTPDGKFWVAWLQWEDGMNGYIKVQLLDKNGTPAFEDGGIYISKHITASWTSNFDMQVTPDGCCVVVHSDSRNDTEARQTFEPYVYKMDQEGNMLWGLDGIKLPTSEARGHRPKIGVSNEGTVIVGYNDLSQNNNSMQFQLMKINNDGTLAWPAPMKVDGSFGVLLPCEEDDFYLSIIQNGAICLYRMDSFGDWVWDSPVIVEDREPNTRSEVVPIPDENGGVFMSYQRYINLSIIKGCMQHITADGETTMGLHGIDIQDDPGIVSQPGIGGNGKLKEVVAAWNTTDGETAHMMVQKFTYDGEPIWKEAKDLAQFRIFGFNCAQGKLLDDGSSILLYADPIGAVSGTLSMMRLDKEGNKVWNKAIAPSAYLSEPIPFYEGNKAYIFWTDNYLTKGSSPYGTIWGQCVNLTSGNPASGVSTIAADGLEGVRVENSAVSFSAEGAATLDIFSMAGARVASFATPAGNNTVNTGLERGIYVIRIADSNGIRTGKIIL